MVRHGTVSVTVHFWGVFHWVLYLVLFSTTSAEVPSEPYRYQNVTCKLYWSLIGRRESSLLRQWTCDMRPIDPLDLISTASECSFCFNKRTFLHQPQKSSVIVCWEVQTFLSLIAEERIQWELYGATPKEKALCIYIWTCYIFRVCLLLYFYLCICVLLQLKTIWSNKCTSRQY